jgi:hypothetical protein
VIAGRYWGTLLRGIIVGPNGFADDVIARLYCGTILRDELAGNFCVALMRDVIAGHYSRAGMLLVGVISKIKQNSSDMNEILLAPCDAGYVQNCTG